MSEKEIKCLTCVHLRKIKMAELKGSWKMRCAVTGRFMKDAKTRCRDYESETWERFVDEETK
ncbi:MAG: hypothetical protein LRY50_16685 [Geovibrio sp.]|jgi:hypothetical protein|uniref:hypothetical protein n=1 Tax=Geovibrio ferrireducens TaxID=46201 RepID=UPI0022459778|nr:hypothetical protein [Geovibrio ferrireducens]MCD8492120.1 hypothetical protein [Geovibrio sp.]MCD8569879.1 hypothetical protein [Geovibrio sp.]